MKPFRIYDKSVDCEGVVLCVDHSPSSAFSWCWFLVCWEDSGDIRWVMYNRSDDRWEFRGVL